MRQANTCLFTRSTWVIRATNKPGPPTPSLKNNHLRDGALNCNARRPSFFV
jgi:hypothetical protein